LVEVVFVKLKDEDAFKSKLEKRFSIKTVKIMVKEQ
jgi:hypothetical protein